ncbi:ankyrin repeat domain-containing protein 31 isoform X3 [Castor canadensis]|uniref:Ankyrin repeat domain-containing protein 31 isoform X3 n=1 Tax=Castor canadensis TaxID=51338 RepID=A0AC58MVD9_CASCN
MERGAQTPGWDSDETVIEGSVTESDQEDELPWRRFLFDQDTSLRSEFNPHPGINGIREGTSSPEIQLGLRLRKHSQQQRNKNRVMPILSEDIVLQQPQDETARNKALLQTRKKFSIFNATFPQLELSLNHQNIGGPEAESTEIAPYPEKELSEDRDSPEISLLSGTAASLSNTVAVKEKSLIESEILALNTSSEPGKEVTLTMTSKETKDEESSLETFVSTLERLLTSPESTEEERLFEIKKDFDPGESMNPLSDSLSPMSVPSNALSCCRDLLGNAKDDALPPELLAAINTFSEAKMEPICHRKEQGGSLSGGNECLEVEPDISQNDEDYTQIAETLEDPNLFGLQTLAHENVTSCEPMNDKGNSNPLGNASGKKTPCVLRRSSRLEKRKVSREAKHRDNMCKMTEKILPEIFGCCEDRINNKSSTEKFRIQGPVLIEGKRMNMRSSRFKSEQIKKNERCTVKNEKMKMNKMSLSNINRRNGFGENLLYRAALHDDTDLVRHCIKQGGNVNQPSYAGWTALHEASLGGFYQTANELLKGGADVNTKGMYRITPLHDAVINGHHKVAELLLLNGADPLFRSDNGQCALDEAKDLRMKRLLEKYVPKFQRCLTSDRRNSTDSVDVEDVHQNKKPKFSSKNSNIQKPEQVEVNKGSKEGLLINKEEIYEHYQKNTTTRKFGRSKNKKSTVQIHSPRLRKLSLRDSETNIKDASTNVSKKKGKRNIQHKGTQADNLVTHQQHVLQTLGDLPEELCELSSLTLSSLKDGLGNNIEACSVSKETHTHTLDLSDSQEMKFLELASIDKTEAVFSELSLHKERIEAIVSGLPLHKEISLPPLTREQPPHTHQEPHSSSSYKFQENSNSNKRNKCLNKWENTFLSFIKGKGQFDYDDDDCCMFEKVVTSKKMVCSTEHKSHYNHTENITNREEVDFQQSLSSEDHISQENELKAQSLTMLPQQEAVNFCNLDNTVISKQHVANYGPCTYGTAFDHSRGNSEQTSLACTRMPSTHEVSKLTSHKELLKKSQDNSPREPTSSVNQTDRHNIEKKQDTERNYIQGQKISSSNRPFPTIVHSEVIEITEAEKRRQDLPESEPMHNTGFPSIDNTSKDLTNISQLNQKEEEISHKSEMRTAGISKRHAREECQLHLAARRGNLSLVKALIESGADVNLKDNAGWTPLHEASNGGSKDVIVELLKVGANVNCENVDGILPLHEAVASSHLKAAEILLQHGADPNKKNKKQKTAFDEADDDRMKELLKSYGAIETNNRDESNATVSVKIPAIQSKRYKQYFCDNDKTVDPPSSHQTKRRESLAVHQTISAILQGIEEKQENLLEFEIRNPEEADQYIEKMLEIKEVMDDVLAKQKAERDDLAKKYRVSIESFKHGALREQLANLATRQKSLLVVAKRQKKIRLKIQNYKNVTSFSGLSLGNLPPSSDISSEKDNKELSSLEFSVHPQSGSLSPVNLTCGSMQEPSLSLATWNDSQNTNIRLNTGTARREEISGNDMNSKQSVNDCNLEGLSKATHLEGTKKTKLPSQPVAFTAQAEYSQRENDLIETAPKEHELSSPSTVSDMLNISQCTSVLSQNDACLPNVAWDLGLSHCDPKRRNRKTASQQPPGGASESQAHQGIAGLGTNTVYQMKPYLKKPASAVPHANNRRFSSSSESGHQHTIKKPLSSSTTPKKKSMQIKDLILLGRIHPGNNILEFKTQEATHKASILLSGKLKVENGQIYQNPVTWLKDLLGGDSYVTWNYAWSKVTYLGKELLKYVSEEVPVTPEPNVVPQQHQLCLPGTSREAMRSIPHYLQVTEILLISDQEFLPCHVMDQHWKFYTECEELTF